MERDSYVHVEIGDDARCVVKGEGKIKFQLKLGGLLDAQDVIYIPGLKKNFLSVSTMEDMGFSVTFQRGKVVLHMDKAVGKYLTDNECLSLMASTTVKLA
jgi:hypothetical protein